MKKTVSFEVEDHGQIDNAVHKGAVINKLEHNESEFQSKKIDQEEGAQNSYFQKTSNKKVAQSSVKYQHKDESQYQINMQEINLQKRISEPVRLSSLRSMRNSKLPESIKSILKNESTENQINKSKFGQFLKSKLRLVKLCNICELEIQKPGLFWVSECEHKDNFCQSCLHHFVIFKIGRFEEVFCPQEECERLVDVHSSLFANLPADIQAKYKKIHQFYQTLDDPSLKLCPKDNCEGTIKLNSQSQPLLCTTCQTIFCHKCFFPIHQGNCDENEINFFQNNLHFRQCQKCKMVVEKNQGCNHITCRCGHQFCYVCGGNWSNGHICGQPAIVVEQIQVFEDPRNCCQKVIFGVIKFVLMLFWLIPMSLLFLFTFFMIGVGIVVSILAGVFGFSLQFLCSFDQSLVIIILVVFFPICMIAGVVKAFGQICCEPSLQFLGRSCETFTNGIGCICEI